MRHPLASVVAVVLAVVLMSAPVAADHSTWLTSQHTNASELSAGTLTGNVSVEGSGSAASVVVHDPIVDSFEDGDLSEYSGVTADWLATGVSGTPTDGNFLLESDSATPSRIVSTSGLPFNYTEGDSPVRYAVDVKLNGASKRAEVYVLAQDADNAEFLRIEPGTIDIFHREGGTQTSEGFAEKSADFSVNEWLTVEFRAQSNVREFEVYNESGAEIYNHTYNQRNFDSNTGSGIGFNANATGVRFDYGRLLNAEPDGRYLSQNHTVDRPEFGYTNLSIPSGGEATVVWEGSDGGAWSQVATTTYTTSGNRSLAFSDTSFADYRVNVTLSGTGAALHDEGILSTNSHPVINESTASPTGAVSTGGTTFTVDITDGDFDEGQTVNATVYVNGVRQGSDIRGANGTASVSGTLSGAETFNITWLADDGIDTDTYSYEVFVPAFLNVYNESSPDDKIAEDVTATFYLNDDNGTVITRTRSDGEFPLDVNDATISATVQLESANYTTRTVYLPDLTTNRSAFLLPLAEPRATVRFILDDNSGSFTPASTVTLYVERALNQSGTATYRVVASDQFDATDSVVVELRDETRHRIRVENQDGEVRVPGSYTTRGTATETIVIGQLTIVVGDENGTAFDALLQPDVGANGVIRTAYRDADDLEHTVDVSIYELGNVSNAIVTNDTATASNTIISTYSIPAGDEPDTTWVVEYTVTQSDGSSESGRIIVGGAADLAGPFNLDPDVQEMVVWVIFAAVIGLAVLIDARRLAPVVATVFATGFTAVGFLEFPAPVLAFAAVATFLLVASGGDT